MGKYSVKIPNDITIIYCEKKNIITAKGPKIQKSFAVKVKILLVSKSKSIVVSPEPLAITSNYQRKKIKSIQGTTVALIKQLLIETSSILHQRLKLVGVGYRVFNIENFEKLLQFKLGYSHLIFYKISNELSFHNLKLTKLFIYGNSVNVIGQAAAVVRALKKPEPYKGKGIVYETERIKLKEGKKT